MNNLPTVPVDLKYQRSDAPWLHSEEDLAKPVDFERKRTAFFMTGPVNPKDIFWVLDRISPCSRLIVHQWTHDTSDKEVDWEPTFLTPDAYSDKQLYWSVDSDLDTSIKNLIPLIDKDLMDSWQPVVSKDLLTSKTATIMPVLRRLGEALNRENLTSNTALLASTPVLKNALINLPRMSLKNSVSNYLKNHQRIPTVIVAAGPSLSKNLDLLSEYQNHLHIIAVDSIYKLLHSKNITPDILITLDPKSQPDWEESSFSEHTSLFVDAGSPPAMVNSLTRQIVVSCHRQDIGRLIIRLGGHIEILPTGGSVATSAFTLAHLLNSNPVILIGQDLALTDGKDHAPGYAYTYSDERLKQRYAMGFDVEGYNGDIVRTERQLLFYKNWLEDRIKELPGDRLIINSTEGGAKIKGAIQIPFRKVCEEIRAANFFKNLNCAEHHHFDEIHLSDIIQHVTQLIQSTTELKSIGECGLKAISKIHKKSLYRQLKKIDSINQKIKDFDPEVKFIFNTFGMSGFDSVRKSVRRLESLSSNETDAIDKYSDIYTNIVENGNYLTPRLLALKEYFEVLLRERRLYIPELAESIWN